MAPKREIKKEVPSKQDNKMKSSEKKIVRKGNDPLIQQTQVTYPNKMHFPFLYDQKIVGKKEIVSNRE